MKEQNKGLVAIDMPNGFTYIGKFNIRVVNYGAGRRTEDWLEKVLIVPTISHYKIFQGSSVTQNVLEQYKKAYQKLVEKDKDNKKDLKNIHFNEKMAIAIWPLDSVKTED